MLYAGPLVGVVPAIDEYDQAMSALRHYKNVATFRERQRRPAIEELDQLSYPGL